MKVLVADKLEDSGRRGLAEAGCDVHYDPQLEGAALAEALATTGADVLVVRSTKVPRAALERSRLALVVRAGAGTNTIDVATASERGIWVANCPGKNAIAVAELTFALLLALDRQVAEGAADLRRGVWDKKRYAQARGLYGRTLGIVGMGAVGREVASRAHAFGMNVVAWSRSLTASDAAELGVEALPSPTAVAAASDCVTLHLALTPDTKALASDGFFASMRDGALFVNTSRAEVVDEAALARAVGERRIRAALDVFQGEPSEATGAVGSALFALEGVIGSHHIGASTEQAQEAIAAETVRIVRTFKEGGRPPNVVNLAGKTPATHALVVRHLDRVGVLARVLDRVQSAGASVQEMENVVFEGAHAAVARIHLDRALSPDTLATIRGDAADILDASLVALH